MDKATLIEIATKTHWHHRWEITPGFVTPGRYDPKPLLDLLEIPADLKGQTVADIGASNGFFSFEMARRGADVTAFDVRHKNVSGFGLAEMLTGVTIPHVQCNICALEKPLGAFDTVLFLGVLYHVPDPYRAMTVVREMTRKVAYIESYVDTSTDEPVFRFLPKTNPTGDASNIWRPSVKGLRLLIEDVGFKVEREIVLRERASFVVTPQNNTAMGRIVYKTVGSAGSMLGAAH